MIRWLACGMVAIAALCGSGLFIFAGPTPALAAEPSTASDADTSYVVQRGDYLYGIALRFRSTVGAIVEANGVHNPDLIVPGQVLRIPVANGPAAPSDASPAVAAAGNGEGRVVRPRSEAGTAGIALTRHESAMLEAINAQRAIAGLPALRFEPALLPVARGRSGDMAARGYFSHTTPEGQTVQDLLVGHAANNWC